MLDVNIHKTNKVVKALKRKKAKARTEYRVDKKVITFHLCKFGKVTREWNIYKTNTCFGPEKKKQRVVLIRKKVITRSTGSGNSRLSQAIVPTFNMIKVNRYDNRGKISRTS